MKNLTLFILLFSSSSLFGQYWFGPKVGVSWNDHIYQKQAYEMDSFHIANDVNWQAGLAVAYTATEMYSVYGELTYERVGKKVTDEYQNGNYVNAEMTNHFLSAPVMFRVTLGNKYLKYYANAGPRLSYWLGGKGQHDLEANDEPALYGRDEEGSALPYPYKLTFNSAKSDPIDVELVKDPNRLQFGLAIGGGILYDLPNGSRLMLDGRITWSHSNMAKNSPLDDLQYGAPTDTDYYRENWEYSRNYLSISIGYLIGYNAQLKRKGASTNAQSKKKKK